MDTKKNDKLFVDKTIDKFYVFSKKVNEQIIQGEIKTKKADKDKIFKVIDSLLKLGKVKSFDELELETNRKDWISAILSNYPFVSKRDIKEILNDFTDSMNTRMREEEKYVLCIIMPKSLILCHSIFGEETITPKWEVIQRMLDKDNVMRFVYFKKDNGNIKTIFFENSKSDFFVDWLGLPQKEAFAYLGGKNRLYGHIDGASMVFELTDDDFDDKFIQNKIFKIQENQLILPTPIQRIPLTQVRVGKQPYKDAEDFMQDFLARRYELGFYQEQYNKLNSSFDTIFTRLIDDKDEVRDRNDKVYVKKYNPNFCILFNNRSIDIRPSFLAEIKSKFLNNENIKIFHAGGIITHAPLRIKKLEIYNPIEQKVSKIILDFYDGLEIKDKFEKLMLCAILDILYLENEGKAVSLLFKELSKSLNYELDFDSKFVNIESNIMEFKCREVLLGDNKEIITKLSEDLSKKLRESNHKIYVIGANEDTKDFEPIPISKFDDNRIQTIKEGIKQQTRCNSLEIIKIPSKNEKDCVLIMVAEP